MVDIPGERILIQQEETAYKAAVSEATSTRQGAVSNFISNYQHDRKEYFISGIYLAVTAIDGAHMFLYDAEIVGYCAYNLVAGSGGTTTFDIRKYTASNTGGASILSTLPAIASSAGDIAYVGEELLPTPTVLENPAGTTLAVFSDTLINAGDLIVADITTAQDGFPENCGLTIYHRPR